MGQLGLEPGWIDKDASGQALSRRRSLMSQGPFSLSTFRRNKSLLGPGSDNGSQMLVGSRITGEHIQVQVPGHSQGLICWFVKGRPGICVSSRLPQRFYCEVTPVTVENAAPEEARVDPFSPHPVGPGWAGTRAGRALRELSSYRGFLYLLFHQAVILQEELGALCVTPYRQTGRYLGGYYSVLVTL